MTSGSCDRARRVEFTTPVATNWLRRFSCHVRPLGIPWDRPLNPAVCGGNPPHRRAIGVLRGGDTPSTPQGDFVDLPANPYSLLSEGELKQVVAIQPEICPTRGSLPQRTMRAHAKQGDCGVRVAILSPK